MRIFIFLVAFLWLVDTTQAQEAKISYFGESITHYGLKGAYAATLGTSGRQGRKGQSIERSFVVSPGLAVYRHPHNHIGILFLPEAAFKRQNERGGFFEAGLAPGILRTILEGETYEVSASGELERKRLAGRTAFMPALFVGFGKDLSVQKEIPVSWFCRLNLMKQIPYNASSLTRFAIELGISKPFKF